MISRMSIHTSTAERSTFISKRIPYLAMNIHRVSQDHLPVHCLLKKAINPAVSIQYVHGAADSAHAVHDAVNRFSLNDILMLR
jgi:hypothetical protein